MKKKIIIGISSVGTALAMLPMLAAFEAHVINVTAKIENALSVSATALDFGTVFPQEQLEQEVVVSLSQSFLDEDRVDDVEYFIRQKPKCAITSADGTVADLQNTATGHVIVQSDGSWTVDCGPEPRPLTDGETWGQLPMLCPYISKHPDGVDDAGADSTNDGSLNSFHIPFDVVGDALEWLDTDGRLAKSDNDREDTWTIDLAVPCFGGFCAQDWQTFVENVSASTTIDADVFTQPLANEHKIFGCDLWIEVDGVSESGGLGCIEELDLMLVLDRSGSIDSGELTTLKSAASAFVTAVATTSGAVQIGQVSFSATSTLDVHLTTTEATVQAAIAALTSGGTTNLVAAIENAFGELDNDNGDLHDRPAVDDVMVIITDGNPTAPTGNATQDRDLAAAAAQAARDAGVKIFVVGVGGDVDAAFLQNEIAGDPNNYFPAVDFDDLQDALADLVACEENGNDPE